MLALRRFALPLLAAALSAVLPAAGACASEFLETEDFADAVAAVERYAREFGAQRTLLVVDIDNTLLTMEGDLGGDAWYEWQEYLIQHEPDSPDLVAPDVPGLLRAQGLLYTLGRMNPPQQNLPDLIRSVQERGVPTLVLTSRGPDFRPATERELTAAGYDFASTVLPMRGLPDGEFLPYDPNDTPSAGLTERDVRAYRLGPPRRVSLQHGVFMTAGQHKGAMLLTALHRAVTPPAAVVYVDDHGRHVQRVFDALYQRDIETTAMHYKRMDPRVARFRYGDKSEVTARWRRLDDAIKQVFGVASASQSAADAAAH